MNRPLIIVAAVADNGVIGRDNKLIWRLKTDLRRYRDLTLGKPMIMGRKTYESIGRPLPGRETIVLTRDPQFSAEGVHVARDWDEAVAMGDGLAERMGAEGDRRRGWGRDLQARLAAGGQDPPDRGSCPAGRGCPLSGLRPGGVPGSRPSEPSGRSRR